MTGISVIFFPSFFCNFDCGFNHLIHTLSNAKFYGEVDGDGFYCRAIGASVFLDLWTIIGYFYPKTWVV